VNGRFVLGCDVVDVARLAGTIDRQPGFLSRVFTDRELADAGRGGVDLTSAVAQDRLAARFAAKEATRKALGDLRLPFHAVEVHTADDGAPQLILHGEPSPLTCSLAHDGGVAMAVVAGLLPPGVAPSPTSPTSPPAFPPSDA
jgi:holo-[acyl-carrier protein] synthase